MVFPAPDVFFSGNTRFFLNSDMLKVQLSFVRKIIAIANIPIAIHSKKPVAAIGADNAVRIHPTDRKTSAISKDASKIVFIPHRLALHFGGCVWFSIAVRLFNI